MSRRRRRVREAGPVRKSVEVVVSALFGMGVVGVVLLMLQGGASPAAIEPRQEASAAGQGRIAGSAGLDGGLGIRSAAPTAPGAGVSTVYSAVPAPDPATATAQQVPAAQTLDAGRPTGPAAPGTKSPSAPGTGDGPGSGFGSGSGAGSGSAGGPAPTPDPTPPPSSTADPGLLGGLLGELVGGVVGVL